jgi:hypothetical protein
MATPLISFVGRMHEQVGGRAFGAASIVLQILRCAQDEGWLITHHTVTAPAPRR